MYSVYIGIESIPIYTVYALKVSAPPFVFLLFISSRVNIQIYWGTAVVNFGQAHPKT